MSSSHLSVMEDQSIFCLSPAMYIAGSEAGVLRSCTRRQNLSKAVSLYKTREEKECEGSACFPWSELDRVPSFSRKEERVFCISVYVCICRVYVYI